MNVAIENEWLHFLENNTSNNTSTNASNSDLYNNETTKLYNTIFLSLSLL